MKKYAVLLLVLSFVLAGCGAKEPPAGPLGAAKSASYEDLLALWRQFRDAQKPKVSGGVPDYTAPAMSALNSQPRSFSPGWPKSILRAGRSIGRSIITSSGPR